MEPPEIRVLPNDPEAESVILGAMIRWPEQSIAKVRQVVQPQHLYSASNQDIYGVILDLVAARKPVELVTVDKALEVAGKLEKVGGSKHLVRLAENAPSAASVEYYAGVIWDKAQLRRAIVICQTYASKLYHPTVEAKEALPALQAELFALRQQSNQGYMSFKGAVNAAVRRAEQIEKGELSPGLLTGFADLDDAIGGIKPGQLITLAGETGAGKSTLAQNIVENVAAAGKVVLIASAEMHGEQIGGRLLASQSRVYADKIQRGRVGERDWTEIYLAASKTEKWSGGILFGTQTVGDIVLKAQEIAAEEGQAPALLVVDYVQLLKVPRARSRHEEVGALAWELKLAAMELRVPVLMISQLSRAGQGKDEKGDRKKPELWHLKESGDLENHSDVVLLMWHAGGDQNAFDTDGQPKWGACLRVAKCRDGSCTTWTGDGALRLVWRPAINRFDSVSG